MKYGILTFHTGNNYGGILQCYGLQKFLQGKGYEVEIINYIPSRRSLYQKIIAKLKQGKSIFSIGKQLRNIIKKKKTYHILDGNPSIREVFNKFRKAYLNLSPQLNDKTIGEYANRNYDAIIVGSDQVWTSLYDKTAPYFIGWQPDYKGKRYSYAACSAYSYVSSGRKETLKKLLNKFDKITVRDNTTANLVTFITGQIPEIVPDPSEIYEYKEFIKKESPIDEPYILTYVLGSEINGGHKEALRKIKEKTGINKIISIAIPNNNCEVTKYADIIYSNMSPEDWVNSIYHAKAVYTDSFHAIMFSLKFHIPFWAYYKDEIRSSRLIDLKKNRNLESIINKIEEI